MEEVSRRKFILKLANRTGAFLTTAFVLGSCGQKNVEEKRDGVAKNAADPCDDLSGVPDSDIELRKKFAYVKESPIADNQCNNCNLYLPPKAGSACGGCMLFKGPVYPSAYCTYWAPKVT